MSIKEIRERTGLSQTKFANKYSIPVRTLQEWEQGRSNPPEYLINLLKRDTSNSFELRSYKMPELNKWKICIDNPFVNCNKIYPLQQKKVLSLLEDLQKDQNVEQVFIFGSSVTSQCHVGSDVDIYVKLNRNKKIEISSKNFDYDLWTNYNVDERLKTKIAKTGVKVYG